MPLDDVDENCFELVINPWFQSSKSKWCLLPVITQVKLFLLKSSSPDKSCWCQVLSWLPNKPGHNMSYITYGLAKRFMWCSLLIFLSLKKDDIDVALGNWDLESKTKTTFQTFQNELNFICFMVVISNYSQFADTHKGEVHSKMQIFPMLNYEQHAQCLLPTWCGEICKQLILEMRKKYLYPSSRGSKIRILHIIF